MTPAALVLALSTTGEAAAAVPARSEATELVPPSPEARQASPVAPTVNVVVPAVHGLALMTGMRAVETFLWPEPFARPNQFAARYEEAFTQPPVFDPNQPVMRWDGDPLVVNAVGHALFGSELYLRARQCRFGWGGSAAFAAATSALWEYAFEANGARPSALDLVYTPLAGLALGEARYLLHRAAGHVASPGARAVVRAFVDPFGELERLAGTDC